MPFKLNQDRRHHSPKQKRKVMNAAAYDANLRQRGSLAVWFMDEAIAGWRAEPRTTAGGQPWQSSLAILTALTLRAVFRLALRQTEGLTGCIIGLLGLKLRVPDHSTLSRRARTLAVPRPQPRRDGDPYTCPCATRACACAARASGCWRSTAPRRAGPGASGPYAIPRLKSAGMTIITNIYPHNWSYQLNFVRGPFTDVRVRQAANYALNRADVVELLNGTAIEGAANYPPGMPLYGKPISYKHDLPKAKALLKEAKCVPCKITLAISTSGSGQMQPLPMNELVKSQLEEAGFQVTLQTMDWNALLAIARAGVDSAPNIDGINVSRALQDPVNGMTRFLTKAQWSPAGGNWGHFYDPAIEAEVKRAFEEFDTEKRDAILTGLHEKMVEQAVMLWVVHDLNPRALSPKVHGFVQAQSWFQDLTPVTVSN